MKPLPRIAVTGGEPAGIGLDLLLELSAWRLPAQLVLIASRTALAERANARNVAFNLPPYETNIPHDVALIDIETAAPVFAGTIDTRNSAHVLALLQRAVDGCRGGEFAAMVTGPVHKGAINDAGIAFTGHTEWLADASGVSRVVMMLVGGGMRVALATTHLPLAHVPHAIDMTMLCETLTILDADLRQRFRIPKPRIAVTGLNPHAGEGGHLGREEIDVIMPAIETACERGIAANGPYPADTIFTPRKLKNYDAVLTMFHDQGLPVLKHASFGAGVNVTLGLPFVRTSVDHGTALELAGTRDIDAGSMRAALVLAIELAR